MSRYFSGPDGVVHEFPDDASPDEIRATLGAPAERSTPTSHGPRTNPYPAFRDALRSRATEGLPAIGGFLGGVAGTPGGPPGRALGAGIGGGAGEFLREAAKGEPISGMHMAQQGAEQAGYETLGGVLGEAVGSVGRPLMQKSLGVLSSLAKRFRTTPEAVAQIVLDERLPVSAAGERTAIFRGNAARGERNATIKATGGTTSAKGLASVVIRDAERSLGRSLTRAERNDLIATVQDEADAILTGRTHGAVPKAQPGTPGIPAQPPSKLFNQYGTPAIPAQPAIPGTPPPPSRYTPWETEQIKEVAAKSARPAYRADQAAMSVSADPTLSKQLASGARARLNAIPGVQGQNARIKELMVAQQAIDEALAKETGEWTGLHVGPVNVGLKVPRKNMGDLALLLTHPDFQATLRQSPRAAAALVSQLIHTETPDQTSMFQGGPSR